MEERIKAIYNDCWRIYKKYLSNHDMTLWNQNMEIMMKKYNNKPDICGLLVWFGGRVQTLHDEWRMAHE